MDITTTERNLQVRDDLFIGTDKATEGGFEPLQDFVGRLVSVQVLNGDITIKRGDRAGNTVNITVFEYTVDPLTIAIGGRPDGYLRREIPRSGRTGSANMLWLRDLETTMSEIMGIQFKATSLEEIRNYAVGQVFYWKDYPVGDEYLNEYFGDRAKEFKPKAPLLLPVGPAPEGWENTITADLTEKKAELKAKAEAKIAAKASGLASPNGSTGLPRVVGEQSQKPTSIPLTDQQIEAIVGKLDGVLITDRTKVVAADKALHKVLGLGVTKAVLSGAAVHTIAQSGKLVVKDGKYHRV